MSRVSSPLTVHSIAFAYRGARGPIPLRDPATLEYLGDHPEWTSKGRRNPGAYVAGARPVVRVTFALDRRFKDVKGREWRIWAEGHHGPGISERRLRLRFDSDGLSGPHEFRLDAPLPARIGLVRPHWHWHAGPKGMGSDWMVTTRHLFYLTWRRPVSPTSWATGSERRNGPHGDDAAPWVYLPLMKWTCQWAADKRDEKSICDAILADLRHSHLRYAEGAWDVLQMLQVGGGYCGGWYRMFQAMAGAQGVRVHRRSYLVDWRVENPDETRWCAIVVKAPGLNRTRPAENASTFHDVNISPRKRGWIQRFLVRRYRFWGHPGRAADGHCINFLQYDGRWYLYDPSFLRKPIALDGFSLPPSNARTPIPIDRHLGTFKTAYLDHAVGHMLGTLMHDGRLYATLRPDPDHPRFSRKTVRNGLSVKTALIPRRHRDITFYWVE